MLHQQGWLLASELALLWYRAALRDSPAAVCACYRRLIRLHQCPRLPLETAACCQESCIARLGKIHCYGWLSVMLLKR